MNSETKEALCAHLAQFVTENKLARMKRVIESRTRAVTVVLEDLFQPHNASAAIRTSECFGVQDVHIIENRFAYQLNPDVVMGASKWVDLYRYGGEGGEHTTACFEGLKRKGYRIVATSLRDDSIPLEELPVEQDIALCFGTEEEGLSERAERLADLSVKIPMHGFTQSLNISVSVAVCLYELCRRIRRERDDWHLSQKERLDVQLSWLRSAVRNAKLVERRFLVENNFTADDLARRSRNPAEREDESVPASREMKGNEWGL